MSHKLYAFSGLMLSGKDFVATQAKLPIIGFADPLYELMEHFCGTRDKSVPGVRRMLQLVAQWGWGKLDDNYPWTPERAAMVQYMRSMGKSATLNYQWVDWTEYGLRNDFWVNILLKKIGLRPGGPAAKLPVKPEQLDLFSRASSKSLRYAIVNARFSHEKDPLVASGFKTFHVMCSEETRRERMSAKGHTYNSVTDQDVSEKMAWELNRTCPHNLVIWNDHRPKQESSYLSVEQFLQQEKLGIYEDISMSATLPQPKLTAEEAATRIADHYGSRLAILAN